MIDPAELLEAIERLAYSVGRAEARLDRALAVLDRLEGDLARWRAVLPDPDSLKAKLARRKVATAAVDLLSDG